MIRNSLNDTYKRVCKTFFPRFDRRNEWIVKYSNKIPGQGLCDKDNKIITIEGNKSEIELQLILIHEICHAVASVDHGKKWLNRVLKAKEMATTTGQSELSKRLKDEIQMYVKTDRIPVEVIYNSIGDCLMESPQSTFDTIVKYVAKFYGYYPEEFKRKFKRCRKVYEEEKKYLSEKKSIRR